MAPTDQAGDMARLRRWRAPHPACAPRGRHRTVQLGRWPM